MSSQEEPESQIDLSIHRYASDHDFPPRLDYDDQVHPQNEPRRARDSNEPVSHFSVSSPISQQEAPESRVEETQFVPLEDETQPSTDYDVSSTAQKVLHNTESSSATLPSPKIAVQLLQREQSSPFPHDLEFRFATAPKPNSMNLKRPLPGPNRPQHQEIAPGITNKILLSSGGLSKGDFSGEKNIDFVSPEMQIEANQAAEVNLVDNSRPRSQLKGPISSSRSNQESISPRNGERSTEDVALPLETTVCASLLATLKSQVKSGSPPFTEAALSGSLRSKATAFPTTAIMPSSPGISNNDQWDPRTAEGRNSKSNSSGSYLVGEIARTEGGQESLITNSPGQPNDGVQALSDVMVDENCDDGDNIRSVASDTRLPESRNILHDFSRAHSLKSSNKSGGSIASKYGANRSSSSRTITRPLQEQQLQPQDLHQNQGIRHPRDAGVSKKSPPRIHGPPSVQSNYGIPRRSGDEVTPANLLYMAAVMSTAEKEQLKNVEAQAQLQLVQLGYLSKDNAILQDRVKALSDENERMVEKNAHFRRSCEKIKAKMTDMMRVQKELKNESRNIGLQYSEALKQARQDMDAELLEAKAQATEKWIPALKEARVELDQQTKRKEVLERDINNQLLDLQRERGLRGSLQRQLENQQSQQEELKAVLLDHQQSVAAILSGHEVMLKGVMSVGADSTLRLTECRDLIKNLDESDSKSVPALIELNKLVLALSTNVEKRFQSAEFDNSQVRDAGAEALREFERRLELLNDDKLAHRELNASISDLREENAGLKERIRHREAELSGVESHLNEAKKELQQCRTELVTVTDGLGKAIAAMREDDSLRTQLQDLQTSYAIAKQQVESSASETEKIKADLHEQENLTLIAQQETSKLKGKLQQSEAKVSVFDVQKEAHIRQAKEESQIQRLQLERDFRARLEEDEARHGGIISGLRRQIMEADDKLTQTQQKLHDAETARSNDENETRELSNQLSTVVTELGSLQAKILSMEQTRDQTDCEHFVSQEQLREYKEKATEWSNRAEGNALEFSIRRREIDNEFKKSEKIAEIEINRLEGLLLALQKKYDDSENVIWTVTRYLRRKGVIGLGIKLADWVAGFLDEQSQFEEVNMDSSNPVATDEFLDVPALSQESFDRGSRNTIQATALLGGSKMADTPVQFRGEHIPRTAIRSPALSDEENRTRMPNTDSSPLSSYSKTPSHSPGRDSYMSEHCLEIESRELTSASQVACNQQRPATGATLRLNLPETNFLNDSTFHLKSSKRLEGTTRTIIPDSQEDLKQEQVSTFVRPTRRVAERRHSLAEGNRMITRTEVTRHSVRTLETYVDQPTARYVDVNHLLFGDQGTELISDVNSDLFEPPVNVGRLESVEHMNDDDERDRKGPAILNCLDEKECAKSTVPHSKLSDRSNSSRARAGPLAVPQETKQLKGILKRTNSVIHTDDTAVNEYSLGKSVGESQFERLRGVQGGVSKKRINRTISGTKEKDGAAHRAPYNRPVAGSKDLHNSSHFQAHNTPLQVQRPSPADIFTISSSPAMGQPQRNSKKRALSSIGIKDSNRPTKLLRSAKH